MYMETKLLFTGKNVLQEVFEKVLCARSTPVVYKNRINDSNGTALVQDRFIEFEEVVETVVRFLTETNAELDHIALKNYFFQNFCGLP